jgi:hypothetical protein
VHGFVSNDPGYGDGLPRVALPRAMPQLRAASEVLGGTAAVARCRIDLGVVSPLLYLSAGITRVARRPDGAEHPPRAGSAGAGSRWSCI